MSGGHSKLSPSGASKWVNCPGSISMEARYPEKGGNEAAEEGTASHWASAQLLMGLPAPTVGTKCPENGVVLNMEMIDGAFFYAAACASMAGPGGVAVEKKVTIEPVHPLCFGTVDAHYWVGNCLYVDDYKFGWTPVSPVENWQLIAYAAGILHAAGFYGHPQVEVCLRIIQPRPHHPLGPVREWRTTAADLMPYVDRLRAAAAVALGPNPQLCSGTHCKYCKARHACPALAHATMFAIDYICQAQPDELSVEAMSMEYRTLERIEQLVKARKSAHEARMIGMIEGGQSVPGFTLEPGYGHATWNKPATDIITLGDMLGVNLAAPQTAITPAQAKTKGLSEALIAQYSGRKVTSKKLVIAEGSKASLAFSAAPIQ